MTQRALADAIGVTYQQVHKMETGVNRVSASRLHAICGVLGVDANYFFDGIGGPPVRVLNHTRSHEMMIDAMTRIADPETTSALLKLARAVRAPEKDAGEC